MLFIDTDSLMYVIETENVYEDKDFCKDKELFGFSNYQKKWEYYDNLNSFIVGKIKDETCGVPTRGFIGLKYKMYTFTTRQSRVLPSKRH